MIINKLSFFPKKVMIRETQLLAPPSPSLTHRLSFRNKTWWTHNYSEEKMAWEEDKKGKGTKWRKTDHCRDLVHPFLVPSLDHYTKPATKALTSGCTTAGSRRPKPIATTKHKGHELLRTPLPAAFVGKGRHTSVTPTTPRSRPLDECLRTLGLFSFYSRVLPGLHFPIQH